MSRKTANKHTALERQRREHKQPWYSYHGSSMRDSEHPLHEHFTMGRELEHQHFFDFESCDREWHKLRHTWEERVEMRRERENHEKEVFLTRYDHIKPNKDNMNVSINMASEKKKSKQSLAKKYDASRFSSLPRRRRAFPRNSLVRYQDTVWKVIACNAHTGKHDLVHVDGVYAPRNRVDGGELENYMHK